MDDFFGGFSGDEYEGNSSFTDTAQICKDGHIINDSFNTSPQLNKKYCPKCGQPTITECPECSKPIAGEIHYRNVFGSHSFKLPSFCIECGKPFPWTVAKLKAAKDLIAEIDDLNLEDKKILVTSIYEITKDSTQAEVGATRIKKIINKVGSTVGEIVQKIVVDVASETAKKVILGK